MLAYRYAEEIGSAAMLAAKRSASVTPEVNLREYVTLCLGQVLNKVAHCGYETKRKYKIGLSVALQKGLMSSKNEKNKKERNDPNKLK